MPLTMVEIGESVIIKKISGRDDTKRFLESLGFIVGSEVTIVSKFGQKFIINVKIHVLHSIKRWQNVFLYKGEISNENIKRCENW